MSKGLTTYLHRYMKYQPSIMLCYRPTLKNGWGDRCLYLSDEYEPKKKYNHRSVLDKEVVIEFDFVDFDMKINIVKRRILRNRHIVQPHHQNGGIDTPLACIEPSIVMVICMS